MGSKTDWLLALTVIILIILGAWYFSTQPATPAQTGPVKIGVILPLTGDLAMFGTKIKNGIELASAGFPKDKVEFIYEDTPKADNQGALTAYQKLTSVDKVQVIIGPFGPEPLMAIAPAPVDGAKPLVFGVTLCDPRFQQYPNVFCTYPGLRDGIKSALPELKALGVKKIYLFTVKSELGDTVETALREFSQADGYQVVGSTKIVASGQEKDFRTDILKLKQLKPDAVYSVMTPNEGLVFVKQLYGMQYQGKHFAGLDVSEEVLRQIGSAAEGLYLPGQMAKLDNKEFIDQYKRVYGDEPDLYSALGQSTTELILVSLQQANWQTANLATTVINKTDAKTAIKGFLFNPDRTVYIPQVVLQFKSGKLGQVSP